MLLFLGILFGALSPTESWWRSRAFKAGAATALVFTFVAFASYVVAPAWMWMYFLDPSDVAWALPGIAAGYAVTFLTGFAAAIGLKPLGTKFIAGAAALMVAGEILVIAITWSRYHQVGTRAQWLSGDAHELFSVSPAGPVKTIGVLVPVFFVVLAASLLYTWRSRRVAARP